MSRGSNSCLSIRTPTSFGPKTEISYNGTGWGVGATRGQPIKGFWWTAIPGLIWLLVNVVHSAPPQWVVSGGYPAVSYYPYSFLHYSYSDVVALYGARRLFLHQIPYFQNVIEYPVGIGIYMALMAYFPGFWGYFVASDIGLLVAFIFTLYPLYQARGAKPALWLSMSPLLAVYGVLNWDLLGIMCWAWALFTFERGRYQWSGVWIGLGIAVKFFPIVMVPYFGLWLWLYHKKHLKEFFVALGLAVGVLNLPFAVFAESGWSNFFTYNGHRGPDPGLYQWLWQTGVLRHDMLNLVSAGLTLGGGLILLLLMLKYRWNPIGVAAAALAWWFLCNKVYSPQYMLWVYTATLWTSVDGSLLVILNIAGLLDFWLAMRWLGLGTTGSLGLPRFVRTAVGPVLALRDLSLLLAVWSLVKRSHWHRGLGRFSDAPGSPPG